MEQFRFDVRTPLCNEMANTPLSAHADFVVDLVEKLMFLHEEGRHLRPTFVLTATSSVTREMMAHAGGTRIDAGAIHDLSLDPVRELSASVVVKQLAVLSAGCWVPCVELEPRRAVLLRRSHLPYNTPVQLMRASVVDRPAIVIEKVRDGHVRIQGRQGRELNLVADPALRVDEASSGPVEHLVALLNEHRRHGGPPFLERLRFAIRGVLERSHGALLAVAPAQRIDEAFRVFETSVRLTPPVDLHANEHVKMEATEVTERGTMRITALLQAVTGMDGIALFSSDAHLHGYRCFIKPAGGGPGTGGARRLAFEALCQRSDLFRGALYRSQDGATRLHRWDGSGVILGE